MSSSTSDKSISSIGRTGLLKNIAGFSTFRSEKVEQGIGDDAAVLKSDETCYGLISSETFVEGVEFDLTFMPFHQIGAKVITAAVSDIYAMNGRPHAVLINLGVPNRITTDMIDDLYKGIGMACSDYGCQLSGGDLTGSHNPLIISVSVYGDVLHEKIVYNRGAQTGDAVCVTGDLGSAIAGLKVLLREKRHWEESEDPVMQPDLSEWDYVVKRQLVPVAKKEIIETFHQKEIKPTAMIDVSQGLINDLRRIASNSEKGAYIYQAALPIDLQTRSVADEMKEDVDKYALFGGEDFELLFTLPENQVKNLTDFSKDFTVIGRITDDSDRIEMQTAEGDVIVFDDPG